MYLRHTHSRTSLGRNSEKKCMTPKHLVSEVGWGARCATPRPSMQSENHLDRDICLKTIIILSSPAILVVVFVVVI